MKNIVLIVGARPNFIKVFPVYNALKNDFKITLIHTGQHYDFNMSDIFFDDLMLPRPDIFLSLSQTSRAGKYDDNIYKNHDLNIINELITIDNTNLDKCGQLGEIIIKLQSEFLKLNPDIVVVFGDVTSTLAAAVCAYKLNIKIAHVESGLRSFDLSMPEEINRILVDKISHFKFCSEESGVINLMNENLSNNTYLVGNTMIDTMLHYKLRALSRETYKKYNCDKKDYVFVTLHRPSNVDDLNKFKNILNELVNLSQKYKIIYPVHPRTKKNIDGLINLNKNINLIEPVGYLDCICLINYSKFVVTDSGGIQEETSALGIPCFTLRNNTERPSTLIQNGGTNKLINNILDIELHNDNYKMIENSRAGTKINEIFKSVVQ